MQQKRNGTYETAWTRLEAHGTVAVSRGPSGQARLADRRLSVIRRNSIRWKRSTGHFVESHCGRWRIEPIYGGLTRPESYVLRLDGKAIESGSTQRECKAITACLDRKGGPLE
jgi:hypothetical protein